MHRSPDAVDDTAPMDDPQAAAGARALLEEADRCRRKGALADAIRLGEAALAGAEARGDARLAALAQTALANFHRYVPNSLIAIQLLNRAEHYFRTIADPALARVLTFKGMVLSDLGDHTQALELYREALGVFDLHRDAPDPVQEATCLGAIGIACTQLGEFEQAEDAYRRARATYEVAANDEGVGYLCNNLAILRVRAIQALDDRAGAAAQQLARELFDFVEQGLDLNRRAIGSTHLSALLLATKGDGLRALGRAADALPFLEQALAQYRQMASPRGEADVTADLGATLLELGRNRAALDCLEAGLAVALAHELKDHQRRLRRYLADAHEREGGFRDALAHYKTYHMLERELSDRDTQKKLQQLALREEIEKALAEAREQSLRSARLSEQNAALAARTEALEGIAYVDALTGLPNRRRFDERAADLPQRLPESFAVAVLDIDFFKRINDTWSHAMGDRVLKEVGALLHAHCRGQDLVARIGGEEFVLLFDGVTLPDAFEACERLRAAIAAHDWRALQEDMPVTVSIGLAAGDGRTAIGDLLKVADERLYVAKRAGRNRVVGTHEAARSA